LASRFCSWRPCWARPPGRKATEAARTAAHKTAASEPEPELAGESSHRDPGLREGATAAAAGAIGGATIVLTRQAVIDLPAAGILAVSLLFVWRFKNQEPVLVLLAGAAGMLMKGL
jgi:hypothetical protein